jgi:hypothetical protein
MIPDTVGGLNGTNGGKTQRLVTVTGTGKATIRDGMV